MRNKILPLFLGALLSANFSFAQKCGTYEGSFENEKNKFPEFYQSIESKNSDLQQSHLKALNKMTSLKVENGVRIIPVVVHVIHDLGNENISDVSIQGALDILNANINGQGANFLNKTPDIFAAVRGDLKVEFRLAKLDPNGNPTTGINRVRSTLTDEPEPRDAVKSLSYWNSYQYLNIWTLKKFAPQDDGNTLLGYAQFPWSGSMSTDGVVLLASQMVGGGTLTHECGHWLGLRHVWGDAICGDDGVKDTPPAREPNFGINMNHFPYHVGLAPPAGQTGAWGCIADSLNPAGEMFVNYMDYSNDADVTMFTKGQNAIMNEVLDGIYDEETQTSGVGFREYMWSNENISLTGTADGYMTPTCTQEATFNVIGGSSSICAGESILLKGNKTMFGTGNVSSMTWDFGDGNTDNSGENFLAHDYISTGSYDVTLTIEYNEMTEARASSLADLDISNATSYDSITSTLIAQGTLAELEAVNATNIDLHLDVDSFSIGSYFAHIPVDSMVGEHSSVYYGLDTFMLIFDTPKGDVLDSASNDRLMNCFFTLTMDSVVGSQNTATLVWEYDTLTYYFGWYSADAYDAYFMDTLFYRGNVEQTVYIAYFSNTCISTTTAENFIKVGSNSSSNNAGSYSYSFENASELDDDWVINQSTDVASGWEFSAGDFTEWKWNSGVAAHGDASIMIDAEELGGVLRSTEIISGAYNLYDLNDPAIKFSWSGAAANTFPVNELIVTYSDNCGEDWKSLGTINALLAANAGLYTTRFVPKVSEWNDTIMSKSQLKHDNIRFKFEYVISGNTNNFYLDNIMIGEADALMTAQNQNNSRLSVYPNPTNGNAVIDIENLAAVNIEVTLINILGSKVMELYSGAVVSNYQSIDANLTNLDKGIYFVRVNSNGNTILTDKLILK